MARDTKLVAEEYKDIPNVSEESLRNLDERIVYVKKFSGDILYKVTQK